MIESTKIERPLIEANRMRTEDFKALLSVEHGVEILYTGFATELAVDNATKLARSFSTRYLPRNKGVSYNRVTLDDGSLGVVFRVVEKQPAREAVANDGCQKR